MSDETMRERVARALYERRVSTVVLESRGDCPPWDELGSAIMDGYRADAGAALREMREPTEEMIDAGMCAAVPGLTDGSPAAILAQGRGAVCAEWRAMIAAALGHVPPAS